MSSLDKMEDYDRLAKLCEKLSRDVAERDALMKEKDVALKRLSYTVSDYLLFSAKSTDLKDAYDETCNALSKTLPSEALERALAAEREKVTKKFRFCPRDCDGESLSKTAVVCGDLTSAETLIEIHRQQGRDEAMLAMSKMEPVATSYVGQYGQHVLTANGLIERPQPPQTKQGDSK